ncbi:MAG TPA: type II toxin-antitoxin system HigB family toxin [Bryobacteraceae bacterium]|nr:type II toxin-antitoxin system HigB family toxin [Bryobacteraceae bacterium]
MRIISEKVLRDFSAKYSDAAESLQAWKRIVRAAVWKSPVDVLASINGSDQVGDKTVFNIAHNRYRLIAFIHFRRQVVYVKAVLTHRQYDTGGWKS